MQLKVKRDQAEKRGLFGTKVTFLLRFHVELTHEEEVLVKKYKAHKQGLAMVPPSKYIQKWQGMPPQLLGDAMKKLRRSGAVGQLNIRDFVKGQSYEYDDVLLLDALEAEVKEGCAAFKAWLDHVSGSGREEAIEF